jgi:hypothetical protein
MAGCSHIVPVIPTRLPARAAEKRGVTPGNPLISPMTIS